MDFVGMHLSAAEKVIASIRLLQIGLTKASKTVFLSKPPHIPNDILYSSADSWRLEFWLIHFPLIINTTPLPWRFQQSLWQVLDLDRTTFILWWPLYVQERKLVLFSKSPWALLKRAHLWMHVFQQAQGCVLFFSSIEEGSEGEEAGVQLIQSMTDPGWKVISKCTVRQHPVRACMTGFRVRSGQRASSSTSTLDWGSQKWQIDPPLLTIPRLNYQGLLGAYSLDCSWSWLFLRLCNSWKHPRVLSGQFDIQSPNNSGKGGQRGWRCPLRSIFAQYSMMTIVNDTILYTWRLLRDISKLLKRTKYVMCEINLLC